jgi:hypothetical protein
MLKATYDECYLCYLSLTLILTYAECHLCWLSHISWLWWVSLCYMSICWMSYRHPLQKNTCTCGSTNKTARLTRQADKAGWRGRLTRQADEAGWQGRLTRQAEAGWQGRLTRQADKAGWQDKLTRQADEAGWQCRQANLNNMPSLIAHVLGAATNLTEQLS